MVTSGGAPWQYEGSSVGDQDDLHQVEVEWESDSDDDDTENLVRSENL